jgi:putative NIF3 family GTP cyclohydrolase 1 type 2
MIRLGELIEQAIKIGIENDPRGKEEVQKYLSQKRKEYESLKPEEKEFFNKELLENPYADSGILYGDPQTEIRSILVGIDIDVSEILLAHTFRREGKAVDLVLSHHPEGWAYANLYQVMKMQADILQRFGVPINVAEDLMEQRIKEVERKLMPYNHTKTVDAAKLLRIPFACLHTPADNMVATYLQRLLDERNPYTVGDVVDILKEIPEYREGLKNGSGPKILIGSPQRKAGRVFVDMTGGTEGSKDIFQNMTNSGINTIVAMHLSEEHRKEAEKNHLNVVIAGHIPSDNLGLNLLLDEILDGDIEIFECSGFRRVKRK